MVCKTQVTRHKYQMVTPLCQKSQLGLLFGTGAGFFHPNYPIGETPDLCIVLVLIPNLEPLSVLPCELLEGDFINLTADLLLHLGDFLFRVDCLGFGVIKHESAAEQVSILERIDTVLCFSWRLKLREGKPSSGVSRSVKVTRKMTPTEKRGRTMSCQISLECGRL